MPDLVTGDAVVLDVPIAQLPVRAAAALIDVSIIGVGYIAGLVVAALSTSEFDEALVAALVVGFTVLALVGIPVAVETATRGRSLGKLALGLRVVSDDGGPVRFRQALFRALAGFVEIFALTGGPAVLSSMVSARGKRLGDIFAGTMVISERAPRQSAPPAMPPQLAGWAATLQLSALRPDDAELARQFLARAADMEPRTRDELAARITGGVLSGIAPPPPPGTPASWVLAAVLAERHRRELLRIGAATPWPPPQHRPHHPAHFR